MMARATPEYYSGSGQALPPQLVVLLKVVAGGMEGAKHELATWPVDKLYLLRRDSVRVAELCQDEMEKRAAARLGLAREDS